jgi:Domain of unknown function (DUF4399)
MTFSKKLVLPVVGMIVGVGVYASAQDKKPAAKAGAVKVFFIEPKNNAKVTSPVHMKFGSSGIEISPVPPGDLKETRPGVAHYHVGIGVSCLPPGKNIVKGTPSWVHFGDGKSEIDMQLTPGRHKLALQLGDDLHNTIPGACQEITVTVR